MTSPSPSPSPIPSPSPNRDTLPRRFFAEWATRYKHRSPWTVRRHDTGLALAQAAHLLGVTWATLAAIEARQADPLPRLDRKMHALYALYISK